MSFKRALTAAIIFAALTGERLPSTYSEGQVWEYRTRAGDEGSLLKIQHIEQNPAFRKLGPVYHVSIVGFHLSNPTITPMLPNAPVSQMTLDASVIRLSSRLRDFPSADAGIAEWRLAQGGVYTIDVAAIIDSLDALTASIQETEKPPS